MIFWIRLALRLFEAFPLASYRDEQFRILKEQSFREPRAPYARPPKRGHGPIAKAWRFENVAHRSYRCVRLGGDTATVARLVHLKPSLKSKTDICSGLPRVITRDFVTHMRICGA